MFPWLTVLAALPILGAILVALSKQRAARVVGLVVALATLALGVVVTVLRQSGTEMLDQIEWLPSLGSHYALGLPAAGSGDADGGMALVMVLLTVVLVPLVLVAEWRTGMGESGRWSSQAFVALVLLVESFSLFCFLSLDLLLFYIFFEATLIPMYFLIGGWGGVKRGAAATKFLLFGLAGGLVMLFAVIGTGVVAGDALGTPSFLFSDLARAEIADSPLIKTIFIAFFIAFALKAPMVPGHTWLPEAAEESTPGGAALMVGILDKLGTFGMIRVCLWIFPEQSQWATPVILVLALLSIVYGALAAIGQKNLMRLIAFTSISHFGFMVLGIFVLTEQSLTGSIFYMVNHGLSTGALYLVIGYLIARRGSAQVADFGGVIQIAPVLAGFTLVSGLAGLALPGTSSFVSEFMVLAGAWSHNQVIAGIATFGTVLAALYILWLYQRLMTGPVPDEVAAHVTTDLTWRERIALIPLVALFLVLGFFPAPALDLINPTSETVMINAGADELAPRYTVEEGE
ncbi:MAG: NADH-quinone oxidoreductase subunit M [Propionibacteriaceae bacterium]|jgi:NADH-quinone oxidoreductase subunit M|nr:NADH-quinone oxidoreductase subunit M [Propionibacteriaceae bacterium]